MKLNCIAVDDEPLALKKMEEYIGQTPYLNPLAFFDNGMDLLEYLRDNKTDILYLDIEMEGINGIQLIDVLKNKPQIILTTAYDSYAIKAFDLDVCDYLLKPISFERFLKASEKARNNLTIPTAVEKSKSKDYLFIRTESRLQRIDFNDIFFIEGLKEYLLIHTKQGKTITLQNFKSITELLPIDNFIRVHKSFIVALNKIESIERNRIKINKTHIPIGRTYKDEFYRKVDE